MPPANLPAGPPARRPACGLVGARYGALGVIGSDGLLFDFITHGIDPEAHATIGDLPHGRGVPGLLITDPHPVRTARPWSPRSAPLRRCGAC